MWLPGAVRMECSSSGPMVYLTVEEYTAVFYTSYETFNCGRLECIMKCLEINDRIRLSMYDNDIQLCACVDGMVTTTSQSESTKQVDAVYFKRQGKSCLI